MRKMLRTMLLALSAITALVLTGCCCSDRAKYDHFYAESPAQAKYTFDVPYKEFSRALFGWITCDTTPMVEALKAVYGNDIRFEHTPTAFVVDVKEIEQTKWPEVHLLLNCF